jgi:hypothetical protein
MAVRKNLFAIGRTGHKGDENQLTEMLAYLFQEEEGLAESWLASLDLPVSGIDGWQVETQRSVTGGFLDLVIFSPGQAIVIVESKLGSTTDFQQIAKYIAYAKSVKASGPRALVFTTQNPEPWPLGVELEAGEEVTLVLRRWQALGDFLRESDRTLARDFAEMLEQEGLVTPNALSTADWNAWSAGSQVTRRLRTLLEESADDLQLVAPGFKKMNAVTLSNTGAIYRSMEFEGLSTYVGFWPSRNPKQPSDRVLITVYVLNTNLSVEGRKTEGKAAVERAASDYVALSGWSDYHVVRTHPAEHVLVSDDFHVQCREFVGHVREALDYFHQIGYLGSPTQSPPTLPAQP